MIRVLGEVAGYLAGAFRSGVPQERVLAGARTSMAPSPMVMMAKVSSSLLFHIRSFLLLLRALGQLYLDLPLLAVPNDGEVDGVAGAVVSQGAQQVAVARRFDRARGRYDVTPL